ncbi:MAG: hypothetical protein VXZ82_20420 [Planctomycetota bacterium]|nr:hypothetical protein [Planctomycetota bacterium]
MGQRATRYSQLLRFYHTYLREGDTPCFIRSVAQSYTLGSLERLILSGDKHTRRASAIALGLIGDISNMPTLGRLLSHPDRKLRLVVDDAVRSIAAREGTPYQRQQLELIVRANECGQFEDSIEMATESVEGGDSSAEIFHQRSLAFFQSDAIELAIEDCHQVLKLNEFHYGAMVGLGHCHLELGDLLEALNWFRNALIVFPDLEPVRMQVRQLEKAIQEL